MSVSPAGARGARSARSRRAADRLIPPPSTSHDDDVDDDLRRRRHPTELPTGRAVLGGVLVAVAALGIVAAHRAPTTPDDRLWLVLRRPVAAGARVDAEDLALAPMSLRNGPERQALGDPDDAVGRIALVSLDAGDLVLRSTLGAPPAGPTDGRRIGVALDAADALGGELAVGDRVDVVALPGTGSGDDARSEAEVIATGAMVTSIGGGDARIGDGAASGGSLEIVLAVDDVDVARRIATATASGGITLLGASTLPAGGGR